MTGQIPPEERVVGVVPVEPLVSVVVPAHNEGAVIAMALERIQEVLEPSCRQWEIIVVDDGSTDDTFARAASIARASTSIRAIRLSRNFGKEPAIMAGLEASSGAAVITIDADLQHPPALIPRLLAEWQAGAKVVNAVKRNRDVQGPVANAQAWIFNFIFARLGGFSMNNASDFKLIDRMVVDAIVGDFPERKRFFRGLTEWIGLDQADVPFDVEERAAGTSNWSTLDLLRLAASAMISFSALPLRIVTVLGGLTLLLGLIVGADALISWRRGLAVSGFTTIIMTILIIGSFIMISLGIIGEYIGRIFYESKHRPIYLISSAVGFESVDVGQELRAEDPSLRSSHRG